VGVLHVAMPSNASDDPGAGTAQPPPTLVHRVPASIARPLRWLISALLAVVLIASTVLSYTEIRHALLSSMTSRLDSVAREVEAVLYDGVTKNLKRARDLAKASEVVALLRNPGEEARRVAEEVVPKYVRPDVQSVAEVWGRDGLRLVERQHPTPTEEKETLELNHLDARPPTTAGVQPLRVTGKTLYFEVVDKVFDVDSPLRGDEVGGAHIGWVVIRRAFRSGEAVDFLGRLIGPNGTLLLGNTYDDIWTDFDMRVAPPALDAITQGDAYQNVRGPQRIGSAIQVRDSPWTLVVEGDAGVAAAPARRMLWRIGLISAAIMLFGAIGASWISGRFARPLRDATDAAEAMAAGTLDRRLEESGPAEVRRLAIAFNSMADRVKGARRDLEARVEQRTVDLSRAMEDLRLAQEQLLRKEKLAILGQLAGGVSHELRNPLGVMSNAVFYLQLVLEKAPGEVREYLGILRHQVELCEKIITDLLDFTRCSPPVAQSVRLEELADTLLVQSSLSEVAVRDYGEDLPAARVDPVHAGQVLRNLLVNAKQAMSEAGGTLTLRTRRHGKSHVRIEVVDTGPGVPAELRERIFEPLFTTKARGIGLGLSVSQRLAQMNAGELRLEPADEGGATFWLVLPAVPPDEPREYHSIGLNDVDPTA